MPGFADKRGRASDFQPISAAELADLVALLADWRRADPVQVAR